MAHTKIITFSQKTDVFAHCTSMMTMSMNSNKVAPVLTPRQFNRRPCLAYSAGILFMSQFYSNAAAAMALLSFWHLQKRLIGLVFF